MLLKLLRDEELLGDFHLLLSEVTRHIDEFHTVQQGRLYRGDAVGGGDEEHVAEVVVQIQVVVVEAGILLRVEGFEKGG